MQVVAQWISSKPNQEFDMPLTGSQDVLFWYECTIISLQFFINLVRRKYFRIQVNLSQYEHGEFLTSEQHFLTTGK